MVERFSGPAIASQCAKSMLIDVSQTTQTPYLPLLADVSHTDAIVHRAQHWLQSSMARPVRISELANETSREREDPGPALQRCPRSVAADLPAAPAHRLGAGAPRSQRSGRRSGSRTAGEYT